MAWNVEFARMLKENRSKMNQRQRHNTVMVSRNPWKYPRSVELSYAAWITKLFASYRKIWRSADVNAISIAMDPSRIDGAETITGLINELKDTEMKTFDGNGVSAALIRFADRTNKFNKGEWSGYLEAALGTDFYPDEPWWDAMRQDWEKRNFELIKSLSEESISKTNQIIQLGVSNGEGSKAIKNRLMAMGNNMTRARANLIARDQIGKLNGLITQQRQAEAGIESYIWDTAGDERVRGRPGGKYPKANPSHWSMENVLCRWDNSSQYSPDKGVSWLPRYGRMPLSTPGAPIQCRCTALPYFPGITVQVDSIIDAEEGNNQDPAPLATVPETAPAQTLNASLLEEFITKGNQTLKFTKNKIDLANYGSTDQEDLMELFLSRNDAASITPSLAYYQGKFGYDDINRVLRGRSKEFKNTQSEIAIDKLDQYIKNNASEQSVIVYRGVRNTKAKDLEVGTLIKDDGFSSYTLDSSIAREAFSRRGAIFEVEIPALIAAPLFDMRSSTPDNWDKTTLLPTGKIDLDKVELNTWEYEFITPRGSSLEILERKENFTGGVEYYRARYVAPDAIPENDPRLINPFKRDSRDDSSGNPGSSRFVWQLEDLLFFNPNTPD